MNKNREIVLLVCFVVFAVCMLALLVACADLKEALSQVGQPGQESASEAPVNPTPSLLTIDPSRKIGDISPLLYGVHVEWINSGHHLWDPQKLALNPEVLSLLKPLRIPIWRFPGGIYSDYYDWRDAVTEPGQRPIGTDPFNPETKYRHEFGTDELIKLLQATDSQALITANYGTGSLEMTTSWLRHFKSKKVDVRYWEIGNEVYMADPKSPAANGSRIYHTGREYADDFVDWADAMKSQDPNVLMGAIGGIRNAHSSNRDWMDVVLQTAGDKVDFLALHNAFAPIIIGRYDYTSDKNRLKAYQGMFAQLEDIKADLEAVKKKIRQHVPDRADAIGIAVTEHFPIFGDFDANNEDQLRQNIDQTRTIAGAVYTAGVLATLIKDPQVFMAFYLNPIHPWFSAFLNYSEEGICRNPVYFVYYMYRNYFGNELVYSDIDGPTFSSPQVGMVPAVNEAPIFEVVSAWTEDGNIAVAIVNKDLYSAQSIKIQTENMPNPVAGDLYCLSSKNFNTIMAPSLSKSTVRNASLDIEHKTVNLTTEDIVTVPPCSFCILILQKP